VERCPYSDPNVIRPKPYAEKNTRNEVPMYSVCRGQNFFKAIMSFM